MAGAGRNPLLIEVVVDHDRGPRRGDALLGPLVAANTQLGPGQKAGYRGDWVRPDISGLHWAQSVRNFFIAWRRERKHLRHLDGLSVWNCVTMSVYSVSGIVFVVKYS